MSVAINAADGGAQGYPLELLLKSGAPFPWL